PVTTSSTGCTSSGSRGTIRAARIARPVAVISDTRRRAPGVGDDSRQAPRRQGVSDSLMGTRSLPVKTLDLVREALTLQRPDLPVRCRDGPTEHCRGPATDSGGG